MDECWINTLAVGFWATSPQGWGSVVCARVCGNVERPGSTLPGRTVSHRSDGQCWANWPGR